MMHRKIWLSSVVCALTLVACDDPPAAKQTGPVQFPMVDAGTSELMDSSAPVITPPAADGSVASTTDAGAAVTPVQMDAGSAPRVGPAYAAINSDWSSTSISILDSQGKVLADDYLNSGSARAGLVTALSGDVELPKHSGESGILVILDRFRTDVITRVRLSDGAILGQVKTHTPPDQATTSTYSSNPKDYIYIDPETAWVVRGEPNIDPMAPVVDLGDDLFRINPTTMQRTSDRIDLSSLDAMTTRTDPMTGASQDVKLYARPERMVRIGHTVVVGISRSAFDFKAVGDGAVALVDLDSKAVTSFELPGLKSCSTVDSVPNDVDTVLVTCGGDWNADSKESAGFVLLGIQNGGAQIEHVWRAKDDPASNPLSTDAVSLGGTLIGAAANDYSGSGPDVYAVIDLATGSKTEIKSVSPGAGVFGTPAYDADSGLLLLPDASVNKDMKPTAGLRRFQRNPDGSFSELEIVNVAASSAMPVRHVFPL
ncbi:MAG TPA: hypothetical protein VG963_07740 [Polyangiaceae bacterium]|nr:hypothetical protein [Polyangiaceae bacterium]